LDVNTWNPAFKLGGRNGFCFSVSGWMIKSLLFVWWFRQIQYSER